MISYKGNTTIDAIEYVSLRVEILKDLCFTLIILSENTNSCDTDKDVINRLSGLIAVMEDEINLLNEDVRRAEITELEMREKRHSPEMDSKSDEEL